MSKTTHVNAITGKNIKAENLPDLDSTMRARRFEQPRWATYWQWKGTGRIVAKGEKGVELVGSSGFKWRVFNLSQTEIEDAAAARAAAPVPTPPPAPSAPAPSLKATSSRAGVKGIVPSGAPSAPSVTKAARAPFVPVVAVDNPKATRTWRASGKHGGMSVGQLDPLQPMQVTQETVASIIRVNRYLNLADNEARELIKAFPGRHHFDPDEVASIYGTGPAATATEQGRYRVSEAKRWRALWERKSRTSRKIGALKTWAWLKYTGRHSEAAEYIKRANARKPGQGPAGNDDWQPE